jgi:transposase
MLTLSPKLRVFIALEPIDMRASFQGLAGHARRLGLDPVDGHLYLFLSRRRNLLKAICFDGSGWCLYAKKLERGTFQLPAAPPGSRRVLVDPGTLAALLGGIDLRAPKRRWVRYGGHAET